MNPVAALFNWLLRRKTPADVSGQLFDRDQAILTNEIAETREKIEQLSNIESLPKISATLRDRANRLDEIYRKYQSDGPPN